jgi:hypothetical protein
VQTTGIVQTQRTVPLGSYAFGLNVFLPATSGIISNNSKRMDCHFRLTSVNTACLADASAFAWSLILGTTRFDWFSEFIRADCILGDAVLPHFIPEGGIIIESGDSIVAQTRNDEAVAKRIALLFQGEFI